MAVMAGNNEQQEVEFLRLGDETPSRCELLPTRDRTNFGMIAIIQIFGGIVRQIDALDVAIDQHCQTPTVRSGTRAALGKIGDAYIWRDPTHRCSPGKRSFDIRVAGNGSS